MEVYIEKVIIDNLVIDCAIIILSYFFLKEKIIYWRVIASACFGTACAVILPLVVLPNAAFVVIKILIGVLMTLIGFKQNNFKTFFFKFSLFMTFTLLLGGISFAVIYLITGELTLNSENLKVPMGVIYLSLILYVFLLNKLIKWLHNKKEKLKYIFKLSFETEKTGVNTLGYLDSGNCLKDDESGLPVLIVGYKVFAKIFKEIPFERVITKKVNDSDIKGARYVEVKSVSSGQIGMLTFPIKNVRIKCGDKLQEISQARAALSLTKFEKSFGCEVLLSPMFF